MSETGSNITHKLVHLSFEASTVLKAIDWRLDSVARNTREELLNIKDSADINIDNPPKILKITTDEDEYTSIRRIDGNKLYRKVDNPSDSYKSRSIFEVNSDLLMDGSLGCC